MKIIKMITETSREAYFLTKRSFWRPLKKTKELSPLLVKLSPERDNKREKFFTAPLKSNAMLLIAIRRPWNRVKRDREPESVFVFAGQNCNNAAYLDLKRYLITGTIVVLDAETGSRFLSNIR